MIEPRDAAFERVFRTEYAALTSFCFRRVDDFELARDLAAETFRVAWSKWDEPRRSDRAWLFGVARNLIGNEYARRNTHRPMLDIDSAFNLPDQRAEAAFDAIEVQEVLHSLPPGQQEVLKLTYWDGLAAAEVAEVLHVSIAAVWVRLTRARQAFLRAWQDRAPASNTSVRSSS